MVSGMINNKIVYTAIFADKDNVKQICKSENCDYVLFTDDPELDSDIFRVVFCDVNYQDPTRQARYYKVLAHRLFPDYDYSLWVDASMRIEGIDINRLFDRYLKSHDIALHEHPARNCIYDEARECIKRNKDNPATINQQLETYRDHGYPPDNGLVSTGILFRRHTDEIAQLNEFWWNEIEKHSRRDQLSFNYVARKNDIDYFTIKGSVKDNEVEGFSIIPHKRKKSFKNW